MEAAAARQWAQGVNNDEGVGGGRRAQGIDENNGGVVRGIGRYDAPKGSENTTEAVAAQQQAQGIDDDNGGVNGGR